MSLRLNAELAVLIGFNNQTTTPAFEGDLSEVVDTLENLQSGGGELDASGNLALDMGGVTAGRFLWIEADGELDVTLNGAAATAAQADAAGASYPVAPTGGETLTFDLDGTSITVTFQSGDTSIANVVNRVNSAIALAGLATPVASDNGGQLRLTSRTLGTLSLLENFGGTFLATLDPSGGLVDAQGLGPAGASAPVSLARMGQPSGSTVATLKSYLVQTALFSGVTISNPSSTAAVTYRYAIAGDLAPEVVDC